jgi:hypothetical protein
MKTNKIGSAFNAKIRPIEQVAKARNKAERPRLPFTQNRTHTQIIHPHTKLL